VGLAERIDRAILTVAPAWAESRARARARVEGLELVRARIEARAGRGRRGARAFDAATKDRRTSGWLAPSTSANAETRGHLATIRNRARELRRNSAWASKAERILTARTIGAGFQPKPRTDDEGLRNAWLELWREWSEDPRQIDADGLLDFAGLQNLVMGNVVGAGEVLARRRRRRPNDPLAVPMQIQLLEADHLDESRDLFRNPEAGARVVQGVEFNGRGQRVAYHLWRDHPGDILTTAPLAQSVRVPARDIAHVFHVLRVGQARGIPWGAPVFLRLKDYDGFVDAEMLKQEIAATFVGFVHDAVAPDEAGPLGRRLDDQNGDEVNQFEPGTWQRLNAGESITFGKPEAFDALEDYATLTLREVAAGYGLTYEGLSGDYSKVNFTSGRMGWLENDAEVAIWRRCMVIPMFCRPVWTWFVEAAVASGAFRESQAVQASWTPPRREMLDPVRETNAAIAQVQAGFLSLSEAARQTGRTRDEILRELAEDREEAERLGLALSVFSGSSSGQADGSLEGGQDDPDDDPAGEPDPRDPSTEQDDGEPELDEDSEAA